MHWERRPLSLRPDDEDQKYTVSVTDTNVGRDLTVMVVVTGQRLVGRAFETEGCKLMEYMSDLQKIGCFVW